MAKVTVARVEESKRRALAFVPQRDACVCGYVDVADRITPRITGEPATLKMRGPLAASPVDLLVMLGLGYQQALILLAQWRVQ